MEAFVGNELLAYADPTQKKQLYYWLRTERTAQAEVDYVTTAGQSIVPIEVKSGSGSTLKSMHIFLNTHPKSQFGVRFFCTELFCVPGYLFIPTLCDMEGYSERFAVF